MRTGNKIKIVLITAMIFAVVLALVYGIAIAIFPQPSSEEICAIIQNQIQPQIEVIKIENELDDLEIELQIKVITNRKPDLLSEGFIRIELQDCYISSSFDDLENGEYTEAIVDKYSKIRSINYGVVEIDGYYFSVDSREGNQTYKDKDGNNYAVINHDLYVNGNRVTNFYTSRSKTTSGSSGNTSSGKVCKKCGKSASNLTAGGYCKTCVDTYFTDWEDIYY